MIFLNNPTLNEQFLYFVDDVFDDNELKFINEYFNNKPLSPALVEFSDDPENNVRKTDIAWLDPTDETAHIYEKLFDLVKHVNDVHYHWNLQFIETVQYGEYLPGGHYRLHTDSGLHSDQGHNRKLSFSIVLNNEYEGGQIEIPGNPELLGPIEIKKNQAIFFPSAMPHCVNPVTKGTRKSLVGWVRGPNFV